MGSEDRGSTADHGVPGISEELAAETVSNGIRPTEKLPENAGRRSLQRLAQVRKQQGMSLRTMARRLGVDETTAIEQEQETADPRLSTLYAWQRILEVPIAELVEGSTARLSAPVLERARLVRLMKTAAAISETTQGNSIRRIVTMLIEQLVEIMPEFREVTAWNTVGQRRTLDDYGRAVERQVPDDFARRTRG
jgi:transcriptional regulator with XRE-family HTH domain